MKLVISSALLSTALFFIAYWLLDRRVPALSVSPYARPSLLKRGGAAAVDLAVAGATVLLFRGPSGAWLLLLPTAYLILRDSLQGRSVGKLVFGLLVIHLESGKPASLPASLKRNSLIVIPGAQLAAILLEGLSVIRDTYGQRLGDRLARTQVVDGMGLKDLVAELQEEGRRLTAAFTQPTPRRRRVAVGSQRRRTVGGARGLATALVACLVSSASVASCASPRSSETTPAGASLQVSERLFFGQSIPGGGTVSEPEWTAFLRDVITPRFPQGLTVWKGEGQWLESAGVLAREPVMVVEIVHAPGADLESSLESISQEYKRRFRQEAVLRVTATVRQRLYEER